MKGTIQLRMEAAGSKETEALKKEIAELRKMVDELRAKLDSKKD
jgi:DNA-directed RNA polymerase subunit L